MYGIRARPTSRNDLFDPAKGPCFRTDQLCTVHISLISLAFAEAGSNVMAITLMHTVIYVWLGMAAAMLTVLQVSYSRSKHARTDKERVARAGSHPHGDAR
jgi:hypothetical protein